MPTLAAPPPEHITRAGVSERVNVRVPVNGRAHVWPRMCVFVCHSAVCIFPALRVSSLSHSAEGFDSGKGVWGDGGAGPSAS